MIAKLIRSLYYILFFAVPLVVLPQTSELFEFNKILIIYTVALLVFCFGMIDIILHGKHRGTRTPLGIPIAVFLCVMTLSWLFSIDRHTSFFGYYGRFNGGILSILAFVVLYYGAAWYFAKEHIIKMMKISVATSVLVIVWGLSGKLGHDFSCFIFTKHFDNSCWTDQFRPAERMFSTLGQPNWLGAYLSANFFFGSYFYMTRVKKTALRWFVDIPYGVYLILNFSSLLFTRSRSALFAWAVGLVLFVSYYLIKRKTEALKPLVGIGILCLLAVLLFKTGVGRIDTFITLPSKTVGKPAQTVVAESAPQLSSEVTESFDIRKIVWNGAWELGKRYPILGTGPETFAYSYYFVRPQEHNITSEWDYIYNKAHNEYLNFLATTGFTGLLAYLVLIGTTVFLFYRHLLRSQAAKSPQSRKDVDDTTVLYLCFLCSYVTVLITNFFGFSTTTTQLFFFLIPALAVATGTGSTASAPKTHKLAFRQYAQLASVGIVGAIAFMWIALFFAADLQYAEGVAWLQQGEYQAAAGKFSNALMLHHEHVYEDRLSTSLASIALLSAYSEKPDSSGKFMTLSRYYIDHALEQSPKNMLYWKTKGKNEYTFYQASPDTAYLEEAVKALKRAYELAPTEPKMPYTLALLYGAMNKKDISTQYIDKTIALKPDYQDAYVLKLKLLRAWKEDEKAAAFEQETLKTFPALTKETLEEELK